MAEILVLLILGALVVALGIWLFQNASLILAIGVLLLVVTLAATAFMALVRWVSQLYLRAFSPRAPASHAQPLAPTSEHATVPPEPDDLATLFDRVLSESMDKASRDIAQRNAKAVDLETRRSGRMEELITALAVLKNTVPADADVAISIAPARHLVDVKMKATFFSRSCRLSVDDSSLAYSVAPLGDSLVKNHRFADLSKLLVWLTGLIGKHVAELRNPPRPDAFVVSPMWSELFDTDE